MCVRAALQAFLVPVALMVCHPRSLFHLPNEKMFLPKYYYEEQ